MAFYLWEKLALEVHRESGGTATEDTNKAVLECLDGFFCHVASMVVWGNKFLYIILELLMAFLYSVDAWFSRTWRFGTMPAFHICSSARAWARISLPPVLSLRASAYEELLSTS